MDLDLYGYDISNAFARADVDAHIHVEQPHGFVKQDPSGRPYVCRLKKGLYGTKQAARLWHETLKQRLHSDGWRRLESDPCIFTRTTEKYGRELLGVYVDDLIHCCESETAHSRLHSLLQSHFPTTTQNPLTWILGMQITRDRATRTLTLDQTQAILTFLSDCDMLDARALTSPMDPQWKYGTGAPVIEPARIKLYQSRVGSLSYLTQCTRPDMALAVNKLCRYMSNPNENCFKALDHCIRYLSGTPTLGLRFHQGTSSTLRMEAYSDATFGGEDIDSAKSQTGYVFYFGGGLIDWSSHLQSVIALSSAESEQLAAYSTARTCVYFHNLLSELGHTQFGPTTIHEDNTA